MKMVAAELYYYITYYYMYLYRMVIYQARSLITHYSVFFFVTDLFEF